MSDDEIARVIETDFPDAFAEKPAEPPKSEKPEARQTRVGALRKQIENEVAARVRATPSNANTRGQAAVLGLVDAIPGGRALVKGVTAQDSDPDRARLKSQAVDRFFDASRGRFPLSTVAGTLPTAVVGGAAAAGQGVARAVASNALRTGTLAAAAGADDASTLPEAAGQAATQGLTGAAFGGALTAAGRAAGAAGRFLQDVGRSTGLIGGPSVGANTIVREVGEDVPVLQQAAQEFFERTGREPTLAEITNAAPSLQNIARTAAGKTDELAQRSRNAFTQQGALLRSDAQDAILAGEGARVNVSALEAANKAADQANFGSLSSGIVTLTRTDERILRVPAVQQAIKRVASRTEDPAARRALMEASSGDTQGGIPIPQGALDDVRQELVAQYNKEGGPQLVGLAKRIESVLERDVPGSAAAVATSRIGKEAEEAARAGSALTSFDATKMDALSSFTPAQRKTFNTNAAHAIAALFDETPEAAARYAKYLDTNAGRALLDTIKDQRASVAAAKIRTTADAYDALKKLAVRRGQEKFPEVREAADVALGASGVATTYRGALLSVAQLLRRAALSNKQSEQIVDLVFEGRATDAIKQFEAAANKSAADKLRFSNAVQLVSSQLGLQAAQAVTGPRADNLRE